MKKLLALVLALVMTLGLATVGTSAAYTDANDIDYTEAVDVMTAVGVFQGKGDAFAPKDGLNRAEAAKLIAYLMLGNKTAEAMTGSGTRFTDVPASHWAAGFIEYLASVGVVSGVGNGQFNPNGQVTVVQFAKMLLVALGYDAELEKLVGEGWSINIQKLANENDLFTSLDVNANDALTREQAAQMCLNDLKAEMVEYKDKGTTVKIGESTVVTGAQKAEKKTGSGTKATAIDNAQNAAGTTILNLGEDLYSGDLTLKKGNTIDDMGRPANEWKYKTTDIGTYAAYDDMIFEQKDEVKRTQVYQALGKTASDDLVANATNATTGAGVEAYFRVYVDGVNMTTAGFGDDAKNLVDKDNALAIGSTAGSSTATKNTALFHGTRFTGNGTTTQIFLKENTGSPDVYTVVITNTYLVQATADYSSSRESVNVEWKGFQPIKTINLTTTVANPYGTISFSTKNTIDQEDFDVSGVKKDDYLIVTYSAQKDSFQSVKPATIVEGEVTKYVANDTVTVDGTTYKYAKKVDSDEKATSFSVGNKVILVTDGTYVICVDDANATKDFVYLQDVGKSTGTSSNVAVALYGTDGVLRDVKVKKLTAFGGAEYNGKQLDNIATNSNPVNETALYGWYTYSTDDSGVYTLKAINKGGLVNNTNYTYTTEDYDLNTAFGTYGKFNIVDNDNVRFLADKTTAIQTIKANNKTVFILLDDDNDITVYTGLSNAPTVQIVGNKAGETAYVSYVDDGGYATYVFIDLSNTSSATIKTDDSTLSNDYIMVVKAGKDNYDNKNNENSYHPDTVLYDGEITTKNFDINTDLTLGRLYHKVKTNSKGFITDADPITNNEDYAVGVNKSYTANPITYKNGTVSIGGQGYLMNTENSINLILGKGAAPAKDSSKDYTEYLKISGSALESYLTGHGNFTYNYFGVRHDDNSSTLDELYVYVGTLATETVTAADLQAGLAMGNYKTASASAINLTADVALPTDSTVTINGTLDINGHDVVIPAGTTLTVTGNISDTTNNGNIYLINGGVLDAQANMTAHKVDLYGCELTVAGTANISELVVEGLSADPAVVTFKGVATLGTVDLKANSTTTFKVSGNTIENLTAKDANIVADNKTVAVTSGSVEGGTVTLGTSGSLGENVTYTGDVKTGTNAAKMTVNIAAIKDFDVEKFSATGLTYTYKVNVDTIVLTFLADKGTVTYKDFSFGEISAIADKKATVTATPGNTTPLALEATKLNGVTVTVNLGKLEPDPN